MVAPPMSPSFKGDAFGITRRDGRAFTQGLSHRMQRRESGVARLGQLPDFQNGKLLEMSLVSAGFMNFKGSGSMMITWGMK